MQSTASFIKSVASTLTAITLPKCRLDFCCYFMVSFCSLSPLILFFYLYSPLSSLPSSVLFAFVLFYFLHPRLSISTFSIIHVLFSLFSLPQYFPLLNIRPVFLLSLMSFPFLLLPSRRPLGTRSLLRPSSPPSFKVSPDTLCPINAHSPLVLLNLASAEW